MQQLDFTIVILINEYGIMRQGKIKFELQNKNNVLNSANLLIQQFLFYFIVLYNVACIIDRFIGRFVRIKMLAS